MELNSFIDTLNRDTFHSKQEIENLKQKISIKTISKGTILAREGEANTNIFFVRKGLLRSYSVDRNGKMHIFKFASEGWHISGGAEIGAPNKLFIDAIEDTEVEEMPFEVFIEEFVPFEVNSVNKRMVKVIRHITALKDRIIMLMSSSVLERYEYFLKTYPDIVQRVPQKMIASFLGITPEALSKVKGERARKK